MNTRAKYVIGMLIFLAISTFGMLCKAESEIPNGWTRLHWAALHGNANDIWHLIEGGHEVNHVTDNSSALDNARVSREKSVRAIGDAIWKMNRPEKKAYYEEKDFARLLASWTAAQDSYSPRWHEVESVKGTYLSIDAMAHRLVQDKDVGGIGRLVLAQKNYESCLARGQREDECRLILDREPPTPEMVQLTIPIGVRISRISSPEMFSWTFLGMWQLNNYERCLGRYSRESECEPLKPSSAVEWEDFAHHHGSLQRGSIVPAQILDLVNADHLVRMAFRRHKSSALQLAARSGDVEKVRVLLDRGAWTEIQSEDGTAALHEAAEVDAWESVRALVSAQANVEVKNVGGYTPLHVAVAHRARRSMIELLEAGANLNAVSERGETPLWLALLWGEEGWMIRRVLEERNALCGEWCSRTLGKEQLEKGKRSRRSKNAPVHVPAEPSDDRR